MCVQPCPQEYPIRTQIFWFYSLDRAARGGKWPGNEATVYHWLSQDPGLALVCLSGSSSPLLLACVSTLSKRLSRPCMSTTQDLRCHWSNGGHWLGLFTCSCIPMVFTCAASNRATLACRFITADCARERSCDCQVIATWLQWLSILTERSFCSASRPAATVDWGGKQTRSLLHG